MNPTLPSGDFAIGDNRCPVDDEPPATPNRASLDDAIDAPGHATLVGTWTDNSIDKAIAELALRNPAIVISPYRGPGDDTATPSPRTCSCLAENNPGASWCAACGESLAAGSKCGVWGTGTGSGPTSNRLGSGGSGHVGSLNWGDLGGSGSGDEITVALLEIFSGKVLQDVQVAETPIGSSSFADAALATAQELREVCSGMSNFGARYAAPCGWAGDVGDATYILDERRCPKCGGALRVPPAPPTFDLGANLDVLLAFNAKRAALAGPVAALMFGLAVVGAVAAAERHGFDQRDMVGMFARFELPTLAAIDGLRVRAIIGDRR